MTKFYATVCLPPTAPRKIPQAVAAAMAPYNVNLTEEWNPVGHWDWWAIHSSPGNAYLVLPQHDGDRRLVTASTVPRRKAKLDGLGPLECYGGPRGLLDFHGMRERAARAHDALLTAWTGLTAIHPPARPLADFLARHEADPERYSAADAREEHLAQPLVQDVAQRAVAGDPHFDTSFLLNDPVAYFAQEHEEARLWSVRCAVPGFALVTLDGTWMDADTDGHWEQANRYLDALDAEAVVLDLLCHS
ncbi:hypothetical protein [Streptomyces mirabilis]|jgi:hypothetical protein|uniref:hypothetical protein n=1 Tax=Streptomyces mirabilis TaxID=68239 RepID=UPI00225854C8|nr:hypothetical protein [Streptomyces mirabilis]MCX4424206.1 hypothetical protein [Streptomyces mirabilis]